MNTTEEILRLRRAGKSIEFIKSRFGFSSDGSVYHHLNKAKLKAVYVTEAEILLMRSLISRRLEEEGKLELEAEQLWSINEALKLAEHRR